MGTFKVEIRTITEVKRHNNSNNLDIIKCGKNYCVVQRHQFEQGDKVVYFPPNSILTQDVHDKIFHDVNLKFRDLRIRKMKIRGYVSDGLAVDPETFDLNWLASGEDATMLLEVLQYIPKKKFSEDDIDVSFIKALESGSFFSAAYRFIKSIFTKASN